jgi:hypothetical protein
MFLNQQSIGETISVVAHHNKNIIFREWLPLLETNLLTHLFQFKIVTQVGGAVTTLIIAP